MSDAANDDDDYRDLLPEGTPERLTIPVTFDMMKAARLLRHHLPHEQYERLFDAIVQLASDELEVESTLAHEPADETDCAGSAAGDS